MENFLTATSGIPESLDEISTAAGKLENETTSAAEKLSENFTNFQEEIGETTAATQNFAEKSQQFYAEIEEAISAAQQSQSDLRAELENFQLEKTTDFLEKIARRDLDLKNEKIEKQKELNDELQNEEKNTARIVELKEKLAKIQTEQKQISDFVADTDAQKKVEELQNLWGKSQFEQEKIAFENSLAQKEKEISAEIAKQQKIVDIQTASLEIFTAENEKAVAAREKLAEISRDGLAENEAELNEILAQFGLENLTREEKLIFLKKSANAAALADEEKQIAAQQQRIFAEKERYFEMTREAHDRTTDAMISKTQSLISQMKAAQEQIRKTEQMLGQSIQNSPAAAPVTNNSTNVKITNNNSMQTPIDAEALFRRLLSKVLWSEKILNSKAK